MTESIPVRQNRVTLRKTVVSCVVLAATLLLAIVLMSLLGSEQLPVRSSLCALASFGTSTCGLTQDQFDILFQIRLPRILLAAAVGGSLATPGAAPKPARRTVSARHLEWRRRRDNDCARIFRGDGVDATGPRFHRSISGD